MRVLVTGAAGFIGSHVVRAMVEEGHDVHALVRPRTAHQRLDDVLDHITIHEGDLSDEGTGIRIRAARPEACIHLAWYTEPGRYLRAVGENLRSLEHGLRLLRWLVAVGCRRFVVAGTCLEPLTTGANWPANTIYGTAKSALHRVTVASELSAACAHIFFLYGPQEDRRRLIPAVIDSVLRGRKIDVTPGEQRRDYLHVTDVASALSAIAESDLTGRVDVCSGSVVPLRRVFDLLGDALGQPDLIRVGARPYAADEIFDIPSTPSTLRELGWEPTVPLANGICQTVQWWRRRTGTSIPEQTP